MISRKIESAWYPHIFVSFVIFKTFSKECLFILNIMSKGYALNALEHCQLEKGTKSNILTEQRQFKSYILFDKYNTELTF